MDYNQVGNLIYQLRKEKNLTQKQLADRMNISDKTISKWERGLGCPDVFLLRELSQIFDVHIEKILSGELECNNTDGGNMKKIQFYMCQHCGNVMTATGEIDVACCGRKQTNLAALPNDEVYDLNVETVENDYYITFSHEMCKEHYISFVAYVSYDRVVLVKLYPEQAGEVRIPKSGRGKLYVGCNKHGLTVKQL